MHRARARRNTLIKLRLCQYSQAVMNELVQAEGIEYHAITRGALYLHRDPRELEAGIKKMALLAEHGQRQEILDGAALARLEPAFAPVQGKIAGAIRDLGDSSGDSRRVRREPGARLPGQARRDGAARRARDGAAGRRRPHRRRGDAPAAC